MEEDERIEFYKSMVKAYEGIIDTQKTLISQYVERIAELKGEIKDLKRPVITVSNPPSFGDNTVYCGNTKEE